MWPKSTYATKASVALVNRQILRPKFPGFVLLVPIFSLSFHFACEKFSLRILLKDTDINCMSNSLHIWIAGCLPLLRALRFAQHNNMFQQADCTHSLVLILWPKPNSICHPLSSYSKHCLSDMHVRRAPNSLPKSGHEQYHDLLKHCIHNFTRQS
jgi:hypothetical protein